MVPRAQCRPVSPSTTHWPCRRAVATVLEAVARRRSAGTLADAYSIARAVNRGWIGKEHLETARRGMIGIAPQVSADGEVSGTCEGTSIGTDLAYYDGRRRPLDDPHGPGPVLLAASEIVAEQESGK